MASKRSRSPTDGHAASHDVHINVGPAETALGFPTEVIDAHAYVMAAFDAPNGLDRKEKLRHLQLELGTHHTFTMQVAPGKKRFVDNSSLVDPTTLSLKEVSWSRDSIGRPCWQAGGCCFIKGNCPPHVQTRAFEYSCEQLLAAMDFADVSISVLHSYPTFGDIGHLNREACIRFPNRFRRLIYLPDLLRVPDDMSKILAQVDQELAAGGVAGLQFHTGWFEGDWDCDHMRPFWNHVAQQQVAVWFTCVLGNPRQFTGAAEDLFVQDYDKVIAWCKRYPDSDVVLTHGLPWRSCLDENNREMGTIPNKLLKVFQCPRVHVQLLIPLRIGDVFDFPFRQANHMLEQFARAVGVERLLYGTDMPMVERYCTYSQSVLHIARYCDFLKPEERALVLGGNARRLLDKADAASKALCVAKEVNLKQLPPTRATVDVRMPATVGQLNKDLETPCLIVDLDAFDANCRTMNCILQPFSSKGVLLRPHGKVHKSSSLMLRQLQAHGILAKGVCCQTVREAESMVEGGVLDVLLTNIIADSAKALRMAALSARYNATVSVCVDAPENLSLYQDALRAVPGSSIDVMIELGVACRTGVEPDDVDMTVSMAKDIAATPGLRLRGLQVYNGVAQHLRTEAERKLAVSESNDIAKRHLEALKSSGPAGLDVSALIVSGGGTGTLPFEVEMGCWREVQCGSYVFNDKDYSDNKDMAARWQQSLFVLGSIIGNYRRHGAAGGPHSIVDVGLKAVAFDSGPPVPWSPAGTALEYVGLGDEHGSVRFPLGGRHEEVLAAGTRIKLTPGHCDPTVNLYDFIVGVRAGVVEEVFRIDGRSY